MKRVIPDLASQLLREGKVGVIPTDTVYGLVSNANYPEGVEKVYDLKRRDLKKPCIILINEVEEIDNFGISLEKKDREIVESFWPGPVSIVLRAEKAPEYLTRKTESLAFRVPSDESVRKILEVSGPLIAPSANIEGMLPSVSVSDAYLYFGDRVDFYVDGGERSVLPSRVIKLEKGKEIRIR